MNELEFYEKIEGYLKNRLSPDARAAFEAEMSANPALAKEVQLHLDLMAATGEKEVLDLRRQMEELYREQSGENIAGQEKVRAMPQGGGMSVSYRRIAWAAAAAVLLGIVAVTVWKPWQQIPDAPIALPDKTSPAQPDLPDEGIAEAPPVPSSGSPKPYTPALSKEKAPSGTSKTRYIAMAGEAYQESSEEWADALRRSASRGDLLLEEKAERAFADSNYQAVVKLLSSSADTLSPVAVYLRGHANFRLENYAAAAADFRSIVGDKDYSADAEWYLLLSLLAQKGADDPEAKQLIKQMRKSGDHPYRSDLQRLLPKIRSR